MSNDSMRLNRYLALCGLGSRRSCDELIKNGQIKVNGNTCTDPATQIGDHDSVKFGKKLVEPNDLTTVVLNKPRNYVCTKSDEKDRPTVYDLLPNALQHLNHVGRLDADSEGLLILTNDGDLSQSLTHPSTKVEKEYLVTLNQAISQEELDKLLRGIHLPDLGRASAKAVLKVSPRRVRLILTTGLKRQIRAMLGAIGFRVVKLVRLRVGSIWLSDLAVGNSAELTGREIALLRSNPPLDKEFRDKPLRKVAKRPAKKAAFKRPKRGPKPGHR